VLALTLHVVTNTDGSLSIARPDQWWPAARSRVVPRLWLLRETEPSTIAVTAAAATTAAAAGAAAAAGEAAAAAAAQQPLPPSSPQTYQRRLCR